MSEAALEQSIFGDMASLETVLKEDLTGDRARAMIGYFGNVVQATRKMQVGQRDDGQRQLVGQLLGGFESAERIIRRVWETIHGVTLVL